MKRVFLLAMILAACTCAFAQEGGDQVFLQGPGPVTTFGVGVLAKGHGAPVTGAPYSASITNESVQTLADGTRIIQTSTGNVARDSEGRTRQDTILPAIGNLSAADAPHLVFIQDPLSQTAYTLNLTDKTAQEMPTPPLPMKTMAMNAATGVPDAGGKMVMQMSGSIAAEGPLPDPLPGGIMLQRTIRTRDQGNAATQDLGTQTMEGLLVTGTRMTRTIPTGEIGNDRPIEIVTEVWTSPDLKTIVYSKRSDPRMGEQTFQLTNIVRAQPDASLFTVPPDFRIVEGPQKVIYRSNQ